MKNFRTYQLALELARQSKSIRLQAPYKDQFQRAILSIALNVAEGSGKSSGADRRRFYEYALGSFKEAKTIIDVLELQSLYRIADQLGANLFCLCRSLGH